MYEIMVNAVKLALSKEARASSAALINIFKHSPEWQKDICTIDAKISLDQRERAIFLEDVMVLKLHSLGFNRDAQQAFRTSMRELTANAFEHGGKGARRGTVRIVLDTCPTYGSIIVHNPIRTRADLHQWLEAARATIEAGHIRARGRGLLLTSAEADTLTQVGSDAVKAVVYRDRVRIESCQHVSGTLLKLCAGQSNPSAARRLLEVARTIDGDAVLLLDCPENPDRTEESEGSQATTHVAIVVEHVQAMRESGRDWRIATANSALRMLLPKSMVEEDLERFLQSKLAIVSIAGPSSIRLVLTVPGPLLIGRRSTHDLVLPDPVSRDHARLVHEAGQWFIVDTNSKHGTRLNGQSLPPGTRFPLQPGDLIGIVPWTFEVRDRAARRRDERTSWNEVLPTAAQHQLDLILKCAKRIHEAGDEETLAEAVLDALVTGTGFENAAVLKPMDSEGRVRVLRHCGAIMHGSASGVGGIDSSPRLSRSLIKAASRGHPVRLTADESHSLPDPDIVELRIDAALCVPLVLGGTVAGYLYMDNRRMDGVSKPIANDAAEFALGIGQIAAMALANLKRLELERRYASVEAEVKAAAEAQRWVVPSRTGRFGRVNYIGESRPGRTVSGDFFDIIPLKGSNIAVTLGDVSGKGIAASILMTSAQGFLRAALNEHGDPARAVQDLNAFLEPRCRSANFITLWVGVIEPEQQRLTYVDAAHSYAFMLNRDSGHIRLDAAGGAPVGIEVNVPYVAATAPFTGLDRLLIVSDGVIEQTRSGAEANWEQQFGIDGVLEAMSGAQSDDVQVLFDALVRHAGTDALVDDATAVLFTIDSSESCTSASPAQ